MNTKILVYLGQNTFTEVEVQISSLIDEVIMYFKVYILNYDSNVLPNLHLDLPYCT